MRKKLLSYEERLTYIKIFDFISKHIGETIHFYELNQEDKYAYVLTDLFFNFFDKQENLHIRYDNVIKNAERIKRDNFKQYNIYSDELHKICDRECIRISINMVRNFYYINENKLWRDANEQE